MMEPLFPRKPKPDLDKMILNTDVKLRSLKDRYRVMLARELRTARYNKTKGRTDSRNYSKIGVAYYSLNIVEKAQERLQEIYDNRELCKSMNEMSATLSAINGLSGKVGEIDVKQVVSQLKKMEGTAGGTGRSLAGALSALSGLEKENSNELPIESLVDRETIERLIDGASVEDCVNMSAGVNQDVDSLFEVFAQDAFPFSEKEELNEKSPDEIQKHIDEMMGNLLG